MANTDETVERVEKHTVVRHEAPLGAKQAAPLGNGRLGGMFWMPDGQVAFQLNHTDYWRTGEFPEELDVEFGGRPISIGRLNLRREPAFAPDDAEVTLEWSLAEARAALRIQRGDGRTDVDLFFDMDRDVLVLRWRESGAAPARAEVELEGWRDSISTESRDGTLLLREAPASIRTDEEQEHLRTLLGDAYRPAEHAQATAAALEGAEAAVETDGQAIRWVLRPEGGFDAVVRLAAAVGPGDDHADRALDTLRAVRDEPYEAMRERHVAWWRAFWARSCMELESADGSAERFERYWYTVRYLMASSNRGRYPVKFNYGNWLTSKDDARRWGGGYWYYNERDMLLAMLPAGHPELARNLYDLYVGAAEVLRRQSEHLFGHGGIFVPETASPDGAMYLRDRTALYSGPTKFIQLIFSTSLEVALHLDDYARYTGDEAFRREKVYPFMKGVVEFFRLHMEQEDDGRWHIYPANAHETWWRVKDDLPDLAGLRAVLPRLIRLSQAYDVDVRKRETWTAFLENLAPLPKGRLVFEGEPEWENRGNGVIGLCCHAANVDPDADMYAPCVFVDDNEMHNCHPAAIYGVYPFRVTHVGSADRETGVNTFRENVHPFLRENWAGDVVVPALLGLAGEARDLMTRFADAHFDTAMDYMERYGKVGTTLAAMLLQSHEGVLWLFPAWPEGWDGRFRLWAPGPLEVEAESRGGAVEGVRIRSLRDQEIVLANPWPGKAVRVAEDGKEVATLDGERLSWPAREGRVYAAGPQP